MEDSISTPLGHQYVALEQVQYALTQIEQHAAHLVARDEEGASIPADDSVRAIMAAVQSARQYTSTLNQDLDRITRSAEARRQEAQHLRVLYTVSQTINSTLELQAVLNLLMDKVIEITGAERGYVVLRDEADGDLSVAVARGLSQSGIEDQSFAISRGLVNQVAMTGQPIVTTNAQADPRFAAMESVQNYSLRAIMCAPLVIRGQVGGVVYVDNRMRTGLFTERQLDLLVNVANQAAIAIDNARVFDYLTNVLASIASGVVTITTQGAITTFNRAAATIFGQQAERVIGQPYDVVFGLQPGSAIQQLVDQVRQDGPAVLGSEVRVQVPGRGDVVLLLSVAPVTAETGAMLGIAIVMEDLTHRRRIERFIAPTVVQQLITAAAAPRPGGELREITVLFGDIQGYTTVSEGLAPEELLNLLNMHLALAASAIMDERYAGTLDKYMGDAVMGLFNTPAAQADHAWRAVRAAWAMQTRLRVFHQQLPAEQHLRFRVGVHTGSAVVGNVGTENLLNFTAVGDAVNVAKRLQESARVGQIVISESTYRAIAPELREQIHVRPLAFVALKGRMAEVPAYELLSIEEG